MKTIEFIGTLILVMTCVVCLGLGIYYSCLDSENKTTALYSKYPECITAHDPYLCIHLKSRVEKYNNDRQFRTTEGF